MKTNIKSFILLGMVICSFFTSGCTKTDINTNETPTMAQQPSETEVCKKYTQLSSEEAQKVMSTSENYLILDVRTPDEYKEKHIKNAINFPLDTISADTAKKVIQSRDQKLFIYCRTGRRSKIASEKLALLGYVNIVEFGVIDDWKGEID